MQYNATIVLSQGPDSMEESKPPAEVVRSSQSLIEEAYVNFHILDV